MFRLNSMIMGNHYFVLFSGKILEQLWNYFRTTNEVSISDLGSKKLQYGVFEKCSGERE